MLQELRHMRQSMTEFTAELAGQIVNNVLAVETAQFASDGSPIFRSWHVAAGAIEVTAGGHAVTVVAAGPAAVAPTVGVGVFVVPANTTRTVSLASRQVTLYGNIGDTVSFQVFTPGPRPVAI